MLNSTHTHTYTHKKKKTEAEKNGDKGGEVLYKLMKNAVYGKTGKLEKQN